MSNTEAQTESTDWHAIAADEALARLQADEHGLTPADDEIDFRKPLAIV